jgi:hypothetical protein
MPVSLQMFPPDMQRELIKLTAAKLIHRRQGAGKLRRYYRDLLAFLHDCVDWEGPRVYQEEIAEALYSPEYSNRIAEYGPHGIGKTAIGALTLHHFSLCSEEMAELEGGDWKAITTAGSWTQLQRYLWPEVHKWAGKLRWDRIGREPYNRAELLDLSIKLAHGQAFAVASDNPTLIEGAHAKRLLMLFDEAKAIQEAMFDATEGAFANTGANGYEAFALALSTPGDPIGRFHDICKRKPGYEDWHVIHITLNDALKADIYTNEWVERRRKQWGTDSQLFQNRVMGEFYAGGEDAIIPIAWVEAACDRWDEWTDNGKNSLKELVKQYPVDRIGVDVAWQGDDKSVVAPRCAGGRYFALRYFKGMNPMEISGLVKGLANATSGKPIVDVIGMGAGVLTRLQEEKIAAEPFNAAQRASDLLKDETGELGFTNKRSAAWWQFREKLDPNKNPTICLPRDPILIGDLTAPKWRVLSGGKIQVEGKPEIKKRLKRSTDAADAVIQAEFDDAPEEVISYMKLLA